jgi:hypothetical protein
MEAAISDVGYGFLTKSYEVFMQLLKDLGGFFRSTPKGKLRMPHSRISRYQKLTLRFKLGT